MEYFIKCTSVDRVVCVRCGSGLLVSTDHKRGKCGHCDCTVNIEIVDKVVVREDPPKKKEWVQMSFFDEEKLKEVFETNS